MEIKETNEELEVEKQATLDIDEEEIRSQIIEEIGLDEESNSEQIDKLVKKELDNRKKLSSAIGAKIKWRTEATKPKEAPVAPKKDVELSFKDQIALSKSNVDEDMIDEVVNYAKLQNISVSESLKSSYIQFLVKEKEEFKKAADAANVGGSKRVAKKVTAEQVLKEASEGKFPAPGTPEAEELFWARRGGKR